MEIKNEDNIDADAQIVALLSGKTLDEILTMPLSDYFTLRDDAAFLYLQPDIPPVKKVYEVGGFRLAPCMDIRKMVTAQYTDWQAYLRQEGDQRIELLSCFLVPEGMEYNEGYDIVEVQQAIREHLSILDYLQLYDFFVKRLRKLTLDSLTFSARATKTMNREERKQTKKTLRQLRRSLPSGTGSRRLTMFLRLPGLILRRSSDFPSSNL